MPPCQYLRTRTAASLLAAIAATGLVSDRASAASQTWKPASTDANWSTVGNWGLGAAPGNTTPAVTSDVATFGTAISGGFGNSSNPIFIDLNRAIGAIKFDGAAGAFYIGTTAGNTLNVSAGTLGNTSSGGFSGSISISSTASNPEVINAPIKFLLPSSTNGSFIFKNDSPTTSATMTLGGALTNTSSSRPVTVYLDGSNIGNNTISGNITDPSTAQVVALLVKQGSGTWILSGANSFTGSGATTVGKGIQINGGVLSAQNNAALGTNGTANTNQVIINDTGILELANSITLDNGLSLDLNNGGTIRSSGSNATNGRVFVDNTTTSASVTLSTVNASDVFTIGNGANDVNGGSSTSTVHIAGPGTVFLAQSSNTGYIGGWSLDSGTTKLGSTTALGSATTASVAFGNGSTGKLQMNNKDVTLISLNTNATSPGSAIIENGAAGSIALTVTNASANTFAGVIRDGSAGTLGLNMSGSNKLTLSGGNTFTGALNINSGSLAIGTGGSLATATINLTSTGTFDVSAGYTLASNQVLYGTGNVVGALTHSNSTARISPATDSTKGTLNFNNDLTISGGKLTLNLVGGDFTVGGGVNDLLNVLGNLNASGSTIVSFDISGTLSSGTYSVIKYAGTAGSIDVSNWIAPAFGRSTGTLSNNTTTKTIDLQLTAVPANLRWNSASSSAWDIQTTANWFNTAAAATNPDLFYQGDSVTFDDTAGLQTAITLNATAQPSAVTVNSGSNNYTISGSGKISGSGTITKQGASTAILATNNDNTGATTISGGTLQIGAGTTSGALGSGAVINNSTLAFNRSDTLTVASNISGTGSVYQNGSGTTVLSGSAAHSGSTVVTAGTLKTTGSGLTNTTTLAINNVGTFDLGGVNSSLVHLNDGASGGGTISNSGAVDSTLTVAGSGNFSGIIRDGATNKVAITKNTAGTTLVLSGANTHTGGTIVNDGTIQLGNASALGSGSLTLNGGTVDLAGFSASVGTLAGSAGTITSGVAGNVTLTTTNSGVTSFGGVIQDGSGTLSLTKSGGGTLVLSNANNYSGATNVSAGILKAANNSAFGNSSSVSATGVVQLGNGVTINRPLVTNQGFEFLDIADAGAVGTWSGAISQSGANSLRLGTTGAGAVLNLTNTVNASNRGLLFTRGNIVLSGNAAATSTGGTNVVGRSAGVSASVTLKDNASVSMSNGAAMGGGLATTSMSLTIQDNGSFSTGSSGFDFNNSSTTTATSTVNLNGGTLTAGQITKSNTTGTAVITLNGGALKFGGGANGATFLNAIAGATANVSTFGGTVDTNGGDVTIAQAPQHDSSLGATADGGITKVGTGRLSLSGDNAYTGATTVSNGTLAVNGTHSGGGDYSITAGVLAGSGTISLAAGKSVQVGSTATIAPGNSIGTLTVSGDLGISGTFAEQIDFQNDFTLATTADLIQITGSSHNVTINSGSTLQLDFLNVPGAGPISSRTMTVVKNVSGGTLNGVHFTTELPPQLAGLVQYTVNYNVDAGGAGNDGLNNDITVTFSAVPEPGCIGLVSALAPMLMRRRRRR